MRRVYQSDAVPSAALPRPRAVGSGGWRCGGAYRVIHARGAKAKRVASAQTPASKPPRPRSHQLRLHAFGQRAHEALAVELGHDARIEHDDAP